MSNTEQQQKNVETVRNGLDYARAGRLDLARPYFADDMELHVAESLPHGGLYKGWDGYLEALKKLKHFWTGTNKLDSREFLPSGDNKVFIQFDLDGQMAKNGQRLKMAICAVWTLKDGKVHRIKPFYFDTKQFVDLAAK